MQRRGAADEDDFSPAALGCVGQCVAHLAAGAVADEADGVESLARAAGGDQNHFAGQIVAAAHGAENGVGDGGRLGHAACADHAAGQFARPRLDHPHAALAKGFQVGLRGRMLPHIRIHRGSDQDRRGCGQEHGSEEVVSDAVRVFGQDVGCGRSDDHRIGPLRLADVLDGGVVGAFGAFIPQAGDDLVAGKRGKSERLHELAGRLGHDDVDFDGLALQRADQFGRLVRSNSAGDSDRYSHGSIVIGFNNGRFAYATRNAFCTASGSRSITRR